MKLRQPRYRGNARGMFAELDARVRREGSYQPERREPEAFTEDASGVREKQDLRGAAGTPDGAHNPVQPGSTPGPATNVQSAGEFDDMPGVRR